MWPQDLFCHKFTTILKGTKCLIEHCPAFLSFFRTCRTLIPESRLVFIIFCFVFGFIQGLISLSLKLSEQHLPCGLSSECRKIIVLLVQFFFLLSKGVALPNSLYVPIEVTLKSKQAIYILQNTEKLLILTVKIIKWTAMWHEMLNTCIRYNRNILTAVLPLFLFFTK